MQTKSTVVLLLLLVFTVFKIFQAFLFPFVFGLLLFFASNVDNLS